MPDRRAQAQNKLEGQSDSFTSAKYILCRGDLRGVLSKHTNRTELFPRSNNTSVPPN